MIVTDTSIVVAYMNAGDAQHGVVTDWIDSVEDELVTTPLTMAEIDHLVATRGGSAATRALYADLEAGAYHVEWWPGALSATVQIALEHAGQAIGLVDASLVALARRLDTPVIATLDERHFRSLRPVGGGPSYRLLPADA